VEDFSIIVLTMTSNLVNMIAMSPVMNLIESANDMSKVAINLIMATIAASLITNLVMTTATIMKADTKATVEEVVVTTVTSTPTPIAICFSRLMSVRVVETSSSNIIATCAQPSFSQVSASALKISSPHVMKAVPEVAWVEDTVVVTNSHLVNFTRKEHQLMM